MTPPPLLADALAGRYDIDREIGAGGMATVYLARDVKHNRRVALKVLKPELGAVLGVDRFLAEIQVTANLQHPNLLPLFDSGEAQGLLFYVMPYVEGETLRGRLEREKQLPVDEAVRIAVAIAGALDYAHGHGVIHRDLKPENILLQAGQPVVADFGIALAVSNAGGARVTQTGLSLGTPQYMSPEQATGDRAIDRRTDIYSLGAITYEMLTGEPPHSGTSAQAIIAKLMTEEVRPLTVLRRTVPAHVDAAVRHALHKLAADRFATAGDFALALTGARPVTMPTGMNAAHNGASATGASPATRRSSRLLIGGLGLVAAAGVGTSVFLATRPTPPLPIVRFEIRLSDSVTIFAVGGRKVALSRDGTRMAIVGARPAGPPSLYLRRLEDSAAVLVRGTEHVVAPPSGLSPSFSPDGDWILYADGVRLLRVPVGGGTPIVVADTGATGSWGDGGVIVFTRSGTLRVTSPDGGPSRLLAAPDSAKGIYSIRWPSVLPGGEYALVSIDRARFSNVVDSLRLGVVSLKDGTVTGLEMAGTNATYVPSGHVVFGRPGGILLAAPFSLSKRAFTGPAVQLFDGLWQGSGGATGYAVSEQGTLALHAGTGAGRNPLVTVDRSGRERPLPGEPAGLLFPRISPDGRRLVASVSGLLAGGRGVVLLDIATGARERLAAEDAAVRGEWTRDGTRLVFLHDTGRARDVVSRSGDHSGEDRLLMRDSVRDVWELSLGPAHGWAALRGNDRQNGGRGDIFVAPMDSLGAMRPFAVSRTAKEVNPAISPDGRLLAYLSDESGSEEIYVQPIPGPGPRVRVSISGGIEPIWGRKGTTVYYRGPARVMLAELGGLPLHVTRRDSLFIDSYDRVGNSNHQNWDIFPGDNAFVFSRAPRSVGGVSVVLNWQRLLLRQPGASGGR